MFFLYRWRWYRVSISVHPEIVRVGDLSDGVDRGRLRHSYHLRGVFTEDYAFGTALNIYGTILYSLVIFFYNRTLHFLLYIVSGQKLCESCFFI